MCNVRKTCKLNWWSREREVVSLRRVGRCGRGGGEGLLWIEWGDVINGMSCSHSPFRQHKTKDKHEIDKMTMTMVTSIFLPHSFILLFAFVVHWIARNDDERDAHVTRRITSTRCRQTSRMHGPNVRNLLWCHSYHPAVFRLERKKWRSIRFSKTWIGSKCIYWN